MRFPTPQAQPDPKRRSDGPIARENAAVVIDHEDRAIRIRLISEERGDFVVAIEDRLDGAVLEAVLVHCRLTAAEDQLHPFAGMDKAGSSDKCRDQAVDRAHPDGAIAASTTQDFVELGIGERVRHAASPLVLSVPFHAQGISSSSREAGHRLTSLVSTSVR